MTVVLVVPGCLEETPPPAARPASDLQAAAPAPAATPRQAVQLDVFQITVPQGSISASQEFWKRVDENQVDPSTYRLLLRNGLRVGVAPTSEWEYFRNIVEQYPATTRRSALATGAAGAYDISLKQQVPFQNLFYIDAADKLHGRTFEDCENLFAISYAPAPRQPDHIRLKICPVVRGLRKRYEVTKRNDEREVRYVHPEQLYDLNLEAQVGADNFLVLGPSAQARATMSVGAQFLVQDTPAERLETIILLAPRAMALQQIKPGAPAVIAAPG